MAALPSLQLRLARSPVSTTGQWETLSRTELLERLELINQALERMGVNPYVTGAEAGALPRDNLAGMVAASADQLVTVARKLSGIV
jgi:hypothetical protein